MTDHAPHYTQIHLGDVVACLKHATNTFEQIELLFRLIGEKATQPETIKTLAAIGQSLSFEAGEITDNTHESATHGGVRQ